MARTIKIDPTVSMYVDLNYGSYCGIACYKRCIYKVQNPLTGAREKFPSPILQSQIWGDIVQGLAKQAQSQGTRLEAVSLGGVQSFHPSSCAITYEIIDRAVANNVGLILLCGGEGVLSHIELLERHVPTVFITLWGDQSYHDEERVAVHPDGTPDTGRSSYQTAWEAIEALAESSVEECYIVCAMNPERPEQPLHIVRALSRTMKKKFVVIFESLIHSGGKRKAQNMYSHALMSEHAGVLIAEAKHLGVTIAFDNEIGDGVLDGIDQDYVIKRSPSQSLRLMPNGALYGARPHIENETFTKIDDTTPMFAGFSPEGFPLFTNLSE